MEDCIGERPSSLRHNRASEVAARREHVCSNLLKVIGARDEGSMKVGGS